MLPPREPGVCVAPDVVEDHARPSARPRALPIWMLRWRIILQAMRPPLRNFFLFPYKFLEEDHYRLPYRLTFCVCASVILCTQVLGVYSVRNQPLVLHFRPYPPPIELIARSVFLHCTYVLCFVGSFYLYGFALIQKNRAHYSIHIRLERLLSYSEHEAASVASMVCNAEEGRKDGEGRWVHQSRRCFCIVASIPDGVTSIGRH